MKSWILFISLFSTFTAHAADVECSHKAGKITCTFAKDTVIVGAVINGGECPVPDIHHHVSAGGKFVIPGSAECFYNRMLWLYTSDGKIHKFYAM